MRRMPCKRERFAQCGGTSSMVSLLPQPYRDLVWNRIVDGSGT
jgi:hypothetical protein